MSNRIGIWGKGFPSSEYKELFGEDTIICFVDDDSIYNKENDIDILKADEAKERGLDYIVVFYSVDFFSIKEKLLTLGFRDEQIVYSANYLKLFNPIESLNQILLTCKRYSCFKIADLGCNLMKDNVFTNPETSEESAERIKLYGCVFDDADRDYISYFCKNLYDDLYEDLELLLADRFEGAVYLGRVYENYASSEILEWVAMLLESFKIVFMIVPFPDTTKNTLWHLVKRIDSFCVDEALIGSDCILAITKDCIDEHAGELLQSNDIKEQDGDLFKDYTESTSIYVMAHREFLPLDSDCRHVLWLGRPSENVWGYKDDRTDPGISYLNPVLNEITGLYWMWKHQDAEIIGLEHYRRYFTLERGDTKRIRGVNYVERGEPISKEDVQHLLGKNDIILPEVASFHFPVYIQIQGGLDHAGCEYLLTQCEKMISLNQPEYCRTYRRVMEGHVFFPCNMFITRRSVLDAYCKWLFSFIIRFAESITDLSYEGEMKRFPGYIAERLMTIWLLHTHLKITTLPVVLRD